MAAVIELIVILDTNGSGARTHTGVMWYWSRSLYNGDFATHLLLNASQARARAFGFPCKLRRAEARAEATIYFSSDKSRRASVTFINASVRN